MRSSLIGCFNLENILAAVSVAHCMGIAVEDIAPAVSSFSGVPGRVEKIVNDQKLSVFVDYAHTEAALRNVSSVHPVIPGGSFPFLGPWAMRLPDFAWQGASSAGYCFSLGVATRRAGSLAPIFL